jgi:hypothetical protein
MIQCIGTDFENFEEPGIFLALFAIYCPCLQIRDSDCSEIAAEYYSDEICDNGCSIGSR